MASPGVLAVMAFRVLPQRLEQALVLDPRGWHKLDLVCFPGHQRIRLLLRMAPMDIAAIQSSSAHRSNTGTSDGGVESSNSPRVGLRRANRIEPSGYSIYCVFSQP